MWIVKRPASFLIIVCAWEYVFQITHIHTLVTIFGANLFKYFYGGSFPRRTLHLVLRIRG